MADRRSFLAGIVAAGLCPRTTWAEAGSPAFLSAGLKPSGAYVLCGLSARGRVLFELPLPARGHAAAAHPDRAEAVAFARRPGTFALVIDCVTGQQKATLTAPDGRHFYGHGAFSADGALLYTAENDFEAAQGVIGIWDARGGYRRLGEFASGGVGPHDIKLMPDGETLVVANGGIETHPDSGRTKLNIPTMRPSLAFLGVDGGLRQAITLEPELHKNSIRHLAVAPDGTVAFAMQWQGDLGAHPPLLGLCRRDRTVALLRAGDDAHTRMAGYAGSVAISGDGAQVAITSPRGGLCQIFDLRAETPLGTVEIEDVCGLAPNGAGFELTSGIGQVAGFAAGRETPQETHAIRWDNHLILI
ncbi:DUF1513 domain-containing protein [Actibacterium ureilyticum]|uniref:DUF1513 domain-containing protein n=1 Tax=Actibacterium ureilyticum TaxID=1590614 RepID=UPI000BAADBBE|nr:DUF1513 domain-containing protein [Actibacterium ureilyticum]